MISLLTMGLIIAILQNERVQSFIAQSGSAWLSERLGVSVWIEKVSITSFLDVKIKNIRINDHHEQALITAKSIRFKYPLFQAFRNEWPLDEVSIDSAFINLVVYNGEDDLNINNLLSSSSDTSLIDTTSFAKEPIRIGLNRLSLTNSRFVYQVQDQVDSSIQGMDYNNLDISSINIEMEDIHVVDDSVVAHILSMSAKDRCGVELNHLEGYANVSSSNMILKSGQLLTPESNAHLNLTFEYQSWSAYLDFINDVNIKAEIFPSQLNMSDISFFSPDIIGMDNFLRVQGDVNGPIRNLRGKDLKISYGEATSFKGDLQMTGLPNIYETFINLEVDDLSTSLIDIKSFLLPGGENLSMVPPELAKFGKIRIKGRFTGFYNDFVSNNDIYTEIGKLKTDIQFQNNIQENIVYYKGDFNARNFDLGQFIEQESDFGKINFKLNVKGKGLDLATLETKINGRIDSLDFRNNELNTIFVNAMIQKNQFEGTMSIEDDLINTDFKGLINFNSENPEFDFVANLKHVKLADLGLLDIDTTASLSTNVHMNFTGGQLDQFEGLIAIDSTTFEYMGETYFMDSLYLYSHKNNTSTIQDTIRLGSDFLNGEIVGKYTLEGLPYSLEKLSQKYIHNFDFIEYDFDKETQEHFDFSFILKNSSTLSNLFVPSLKLRDSLFISGHYYSDQDDLLLDVKTNEFSWDSYKIVQPQFTLQTSDDHALALFETKELIIKEPSKQDTLKLGMDQLRFDMNLKNDSALFGFNWYNQNSKYKNKGDIKGVLNVKSSKKMNIQFTKVDMVINDSIWKVKQRSGLSIDTSSISFDSLKFYSQNQSVLFNGVIAKSLKESFQIQFQNFNISVFNIITKQSGIKLKGFITGDFQLIDAYDQAGFLADLKIKSFVLNGENLGDAELKSTWNTDQSVFVNLSLQKRGSKGEYKPLYLEGYYYPKSIENQLDMDLSLRNMSLSFLKPFLDSFVSDLEGQATGEINLKGTVEKPTINGQLDLARTQFRIIYLNTLYSLSGTLFLDNEMLGFNEVVVFDTVGNQATIQGGLVHKNLRNFGVDLKVFPRNFVGLNTLKGMNELFYGKAVVSGDLSIKGPFDNIFLDVNVSSESGTSLTIPINTTLGVSDNSFIVFIDKTDTTSNKNKKAFAPQLQSFSLNMDLNITPDAKIQIFLPSQLGEIDARGSGDLNMNLSRTGSFRMSGDYRVYRGLFHFKIRNLLNRRFQLNEGGTISWTGDPYAGVLGMSAKYELKTSLNSLGLEQDSSYRNRVPVDCIIGLTGPIMDPNVKFRFEFPNATEEVKQYVFTKIDTTNPSEMSQQMLSLLVFNSFSFNNGTGNSTLGSSVSGSSMQIVANQLSNWLSQISKDVDIGIKYRPGGELTNEEVEVALSTQLFDERVTIDGNFGYQNVQNNPSTNASSIVGDLNVEVKITKDGRLRLKAFNRTNTVDLLDNTSPYTQGVGIFYRKEFNNFEELFTSQRRQERKRNEEQNRVKSKAVQPKEEDEVNKAD